MLKIRGIAISLEIPSGESLLPLVDKGGFSMPEESVDSQGRQTMRSSKKIGPVTLGLVRKGNVAMISSKAHTTYTIPELADQTDLLLQELRAVGLLN